MAVAERCRKYQHRCHSDQSVMACEPRSLNDLPDEILLKIYSHFGPGDLIRIIANVCEKWNILAKDKILWKTLSYSCDDSSDVSCIAEVLRAAPALHSLIIRERGDVANILEFLNNVRGDLRKLILQCCWVGEDSTGLLANIVAMYPDLEALSLEHCHRLTSADYCLLPWLKKLSELNLSYCEDLSGETVRLIADSCQDLKKLSLVAVTDVEDDDVIHVIRSLGKQLTSLVLIVKGLTDAAYSYLNNCARLQTLAVTYCDRMTDRGLLEGIGSLHELTSLRLNGGHNLTAQALSTFLHRPSMASMVSLDLSSCSNLDDEGLKGIAERCIHLKELAVCRCRAVTDAGISLVISYCSQLRVLSLAGLMSITGEGYLTLLSSHLPRLRRLSLSGCNNVCDKYVEELKAAAPELMLGVMFACSLGKSIRHQKTESERRQWELRERLLRKD